MTITEEPMSDNDVFLSIIIPAYNESKRLAEPLKEVIAYAQSLGRSFEIIVVDDGSGDNTSEIAKNILAGIPGKVLRNEPNRGKGYSIRRGMLEAKGEWRLFSDADLSTPITEFEKFRKVMEDGYDVIIASRALPDSDLAVRQPRFREFTGRVFNTVVQTFLIPGICDTQCGFKLFRGSVADKIFPQQTLDGFSFDVELLMLAKRNGFQIKEVPVRWINDERSTVSGLTGAKGFWDLFKLRMKR